MNSLFQRFILLFLILVSNLVTALPQTLNSGANEFNKLQSVTSDGSTEGKIIAVLSMVIGVFVAFSGYRLFKAALFIAGFILFSDICFTVMLRMEPSSGYSNRDLLLFLVPAAVGIIGGLIAYRLWRFGLSLIGALGGATVAAILLNMGIRNSLSSDGAIIGFVIAFAILGAIVIHFVEKPLIILSTALVGSYSAFIGLDAFTKTGFNDAVQSVLMSGNKPSAVTGAEIGMVVGVLVLSGFASVYQYQTTKDHKHR